MIPDIKALQTVAAALDRHSISYAVGGSGLLHSLGLTDRVRDWDVMTEAPKEQVCTALDGFAVEEIQSGDYPFATSYKLLVRERLPQVEVLGSFCIHSERGLCHFPAVRSGLWEGVRMGSPEVWYAAYALMGREDKAALLLAYLNEKGADGEAVDLLLREPLPEPVADSLSVLRRKG